MKNIPTILSLVYQERITNICMNLHKLCGLKYYVCYIIFNNGQIFVLSNMFHMLISYYVDELYKEDFNFNKEITSDITHYLCNNSIAITEKFKDKLENKFNIFRTYYLVRNSPECQFIFGAIKDYKIDNYQYIYNHTLKNFEEFCCYFINETIDIIKARNPTYYSSIILNDPVYRRGIINMSSSDISKLTARETDCLLLASQGKTASEIAKNLGISKNTVDGYCSEIKRKLKALNMNHAIFEGIKYGYIGAFNKRWKKIDNFLLDQIILPKNISSLSILNKNKLFR